jgi:hypothetical protein
MENCLYRQDVVAAILARKHNNRYLQQSWYTAYMNSLVNSTIMLAEAYGGYEQLEHLSQMLVAKPADMVSFSNRQSANYCLGFIAENDFTNPQLPQIAVTIVSHLLEVLGDDTDLDVIQGVEHPAVLVIFRVRCCGYQWC